MEKDNYLRVIKQSDPNYMQILELSVTYGNPVLIENVGKYTFGLLEYLILKFF